MTVISSKEFAANQQKYFDWARERREVCFSVREGNSTFTVSIANDKGQKYLEPDDDVRNFITVEDILKASTDYADMQEEPMIFEPDEDFYRSISAEEFRGRLIEVVKKIDKKYAKTCK